MPAPLSASVADQLINFLLRAHINAARRIVQQIHFGVRQQPFADDDFLLVAAAQAATPAARGEPSLTCICSIICCTAVAFFLAVYQTKARHSRSMIGRIALSRTDIGKISPSVLRSSGISAMR